MKIRTREELLNVGDRYNIQRYDDGRINRIDVFKNDQKIHETQAIYKTFNNLTRLTDVKGFLFDEVWNSAETPELQWYDRKPTDIFLSYANTDAPAASSSKWFYQVPAGRKCYVEMLTLSLERVSVAAPVGVVSAYINLDPQSTLPSSAGLLTSVYLRSNGVGDLANQSLGQSLLLNSSDLIQLWTGDTSTGGTVNYVGTVKGTEFDA